MTTGSHRSVSGAALTPTWSMKRAALSVIVSMLFLMLIDPVAAVSTFVAVTAGVLIAFTSLGRQRGRHRVSQPGSDSGTHPVVRSWPTRQP